MFSKHILFSLLYKNNATVSWNIYIFVCSLFKVAISNSDFVPSSDWMVMNWQGCGSKQSEPDSTYDPYIFLRHWGIPQKTSVRISRPEFKPGTSQTQIGSVTAWADLLWDVTLCNLLDVYRRFERICCLHFQGRRLKEFGYDAPHISEVTDLHSNRSKSLKSYFGYLDFLSSSANLNPNFLGCEDLKAMKGGSLLGLRFHS
jgi:hypothetical protein